MKEQVLTLLEKGIYAVPWVQSPIPPNSSIYAPRRLYSRMVPDDFYHEYKHQLMHSLLPPVFVFITPERLACSGWDGLLDELYENKRIGLFVLDEAQVILDVSNSSSSCFLFSDNLSTIVGHLFPTKCLLLPLLDSGRLTGHVSPVSSTAKYEDSISRRSHPGTLGINEPEYVNGNSTIYRRSRLSGYNQKSR